MSFARPIAGPVATSLARAITGASEGGGGGGDPYAANGFDPALVLDFPGTLNSGTPFYRKQGSTTTLADFGFPERSGLATLTNASGNVVWTAQNLLTDSNDVEGTGWTTNGTGITDTGSTVTDPAGGAAKVYTVPTDTSVFQNVAGGVLGAQYLSGVWLKANKAATLGIQRMDGTFNFNSISVTTDWTFFSAEAVRGSGSSSLRIRISNESSAGFGVAGLELSFFAARVYRSDLGGMDDVPESYRGLSSDAKYLPTTTTARYLPRFGNHKWSGSAWVPAGTLEERQARTNLFPASDVSDATWVGSGITKSAGGDSPLGTGTATKIASSTASPALHRVSDVVTVPSGETVVCYAVAKAAELSWLIISQGDDFIDASFSLSTGAVGTVDSGVTAGVVDMADGWYLCWAAFTTDATSERYDLYISDADGALTSTLAIGDGILIAHAQAEVGSTPSSIIPTTGAATARTADPALTVAAADAPYSASGLSLAVIGDVTYADEGLNENPKLLERRASATARMEAYNDCRGAETGRPYAFLVDGADQLAGQADATPDLTPGIGVPLHFSFRAADGALQASRDGAAGAEDTGAASIPDLSAADLDIASDNFMGNIKRIVGWAEDIGEAGIEQASTEDNTAP